ncbi:MAG: beta-galactosidase [Patescibacteria group bacterium]
MKRFISTLLTLFIVLTISFNKASPSFAACSSAAYPETTTGMCHQVSMLGDANVTWAYTVGEGNWKTLEPQRGVFNWTALDAAVETAKCAKKKIWIQVLTDDPSGTIPQWALDAGMHQFPEDYGGFTMSRPVQWDPMYHTFLQEILTAMAARYDNNDGNNDAIEAVLMMSGGHYGEMSLHGDRSDSIRNAYLNEMSHFTGISVADLEKQQDLSRGTPWPPGIQRTPPPMDNPRYLFDQKFVENVSKLTDMYAQTFANKPVVLQLGTTSMWKKYNDYDSRFVAVNPMYYSANKYGSHVWFKQNGMGNSTDDGYNTFFSRYKGETRFIREIGHLESMCWGLGGCARTSQADACTWNTETLGNALGAGVSAICFQRQFFTDTVHYPCVFNYLDLQGRLRNNAKGILNPPAASCTYDPSKPGNVGENKCFSWQLPDPTPGPPPSCVCKNVVVPGVVNPTCEANPDETVKTDNCGPLKTPKVTRTGPAVVTCACVDKTGCWTNSSGTVVANFCTAGKFPVVSGTSPTFTCSCEDANTALTTFFNIINGIMIPLTIILGIFIIVLAGYKILTSQGDPTKLQEGKDNLTSAIIGLIFVLMAVSILRVVIKALITGNVDPFS